MIRSSGSPPRCCHPCTGCCTQRAPRRSVARQPRAQICAPLGAAASQVFDLLDPSWGGTSSDPGPTVPLALAARSPGDPDGPTAVTARCSGGPRAPMPTSTRLPLQHVTGAVRAAYLRHFRGRHRLSGAWHDARMSEQETGSGSLATTRSRSSWSSRFTRVTPRRSAACCAVIPRWHQPDLAARTAARRRHCTLSLTGPATSPAGRKSSDS